MNGVVCIGLNMMERPPLTESESLWASKRDVKRATAALPTEGGEEGMGGDAGGAHGEYGLFEAAGGRKGGGPNNGISGGGGKDGG